MGFDAWYRCNQTSALPSPCGCVAGHDVCECDDLCQCRNYGYTCWRERSVFNITSHASQVLRNSGLILHPEEMDGWEVGDVLDAVRAILEEKEIDTLDEMAHKADTDRASARVSVLLKKVGYEDAVHFYETMRLQFSGLDDLTETKTVCANDRVFSTLGINPSWELRACSLSYARLQFGPINEMDTYRGMYQRFLAELEEYDTGLVFRGAC